MRPGILVDETWNPRRWSVVGDLRLERERKKTNSVALEPPPRKDSKENPGELGGLLLDPRRERVFKKKKLGRLGAVVGAGNRLCWAGDRCSCSCRNSSTDDAAR